ncbi:LOW QUALITY PROTEIN: NXPE family member 4-like [Pecten maximus]|uniref:LOW QUALITY PROTEIN: NXPE family member 4-like n=1 Tax=Pecten maximus TaxID=6579 RepID=UPI0014587CF3|nr:LOW QUALITY PROTEIN: NXPE family member 4-like [Pecten maximus]
MRMRFSTKKITTRYLLLAITSCIIFFVFSRYLSDEDSILAFAGGGHSASRFKETVGTYLFRKTPAQKVVEKLEISTLPNGTYSKISFINRRQIYSVGDMLVVKITLYDSTGTRIRRGGDRLRIVLIETKLRANVNGKIIDNGDGTYTGTVLLPWRGTPKLVVLLSIPRQVHDTVVDAVNEYGTMRFIMGIFSKTTDNITISERTPCGPLPMIKGFDNLYNMTKMVYNMPWYCVKPKSVELTAKHWKQSVTATNFTLPFNVTRILLAHQHKPILNWIFVKVEGAESLMRTSRTPCHKRSREKTWEVGTSGFYYNNNWVNINCTNQYKQTPSQYAKCLAGRHLVLIGDSNIRSYLEFFTKFLHLNITIGNPADHAPGLVFGYNSARSISATWRPHGVPYFAAFPYNKNVSHSHIIDSRPLNMESDNRTIVVIHLWAHFLAIPIHIVEERIRDVRKAVERLLTRAPNVTVVIKGPQSHLENQIYLQVDFKRVSFEQIWRHEFKHLRKEVIYLDYWDITTGSLSKHLHPSRTVLKDMINTFINHVCDV